MQKPENMLVCLSPSISIHESSAHFLHPQQSCSWNFLFGIVWESDKSPGKIHKGNNSAVVYMFSGNHGWPQPQLHGELHRRLLQHIMGVGANMLHKTEVMKTGRVQAPQFTVINSRWIKGGNKGDHTA